MGKVIKNKEIRLQIREDLYEKADLGVLIPEAAIVGIRKISGLTQDAFAERIGVSVATLKAIEQGRANPRVSTLEKILKISGFKLTVGTVSKA